MECSGYVSFPILGIFQETLTNKNDRYNEYSNPYNTVLL